MQSSTLSASTAGRNGLEATGLARRALHVLLPVALLAMLAARRWAQLGDAPTGIDPGNWFAFGEGLFGGLGKSTSGAYPPLIPAAMHLGRQFADPFVVAKVVGVGSLLAVAAAVYTIVRSTAGPWFGFGAAALIATANPVSEAVAYGGYPQNYAFAALLLAGWFAARFLRFGGLSLAAGTALLLVLTALTHHMYFLVAVAVVGTIWLIWLTTGPARPTFVRRSAGLMLGGGTAALAFLPTFLAIDGAGYSAPLNVNNISLLEATRYTLRDAPWLWAGIGTGAAVHFVLSVRRRNDPLWQLSFALVAPSLLAFVLTHEPRLTPLVMAGAALAVVLALHELAGRERDGLWAAAAITAPVTILIAVAPIVDTQAAEYHDFYRVADADLTGTAAWIDSHGSDAGVVVSSGNRGWPVGWWLEGLTDARVVVGSNVQFLAFPEERANALLAAQFLDATLTAPDLTALAQRHDIDFLVIQRTEFPGWERWLGDGFDVELAYENASYVILALRR